MKIFNFLIYTVFLCKLLFVIGVDTERIVLLNLELLIFHEDEEDGLFKTSVSLPHLLLLKGERGTGVIGHY